MKLVIPSPADTLVAAVDVLPLFDLAEVFSLCHFGNDAVTQLAESGGKDSCGCIRKMIIINYFKVFLHICITYNITVIRHININTGLNT